MNGEMWRWFWPVGRVEMRDLSIIGWTALIYFLPAPYWGSAIAFCILIHLLDPK